MDRIVGKREGHVGLGVGESSREGVLAAGNGGGGGEFHVVERRGLITAGRC